MHDASVWLLPAVLLGWAGISVLVSVSTGWYRLATRFRARAAIDGERFSLVSMALGTGPFTNTYRHCLFVTVGRAGIALSILFPFRIFHPPLMIPWSELQAVQPEARWFGSGVGVYIRGFNKRLFFRGRISQKIMQEFRLYRPGAT